MAIGPDLRIGDSDREAAAALLREHYAQGRLTLEEFNQRLDATFAATTQRQLAQTSRDLPHVGMPGLRPAQAGQRMDRSRRSYRDAPRLARLLAVFIAVMVLWLTMFGLDLRTFPWPGRLAVFLAVLALARGIMRWIWRHGGARGGPRCGRHHPRGPHGPWHGL